MMLRHFALAAALACAGCGIKGPLYLPPPAQPAATPPAAAPSAGPGAPNAPAAANPTTAPKKN